MTKPMTPREEAKRLIYAMWQVEPDYCLDADGGEIPYLGTAQKYALAFCWEMINRQTFGIESRLDYWLNVKRHIENYEV